MATSIDVSIETAKMMSSATIGLAFRKPDSPKLRATKKAVMAPVMNTSPCAKLIMNSTPYTSVYPSAMSA